MSAVGRSKKGPFQEGAVPGFYRTHDLDKVRLPSAESQSLDHEDLLPGP